MEHPDSPPRNPRAIRTTSMPPPQSDIPQSQPQSQSAGIALYTSQRRSSPVTLTQPQHVPPPNPQNFATSHAFHSHADQGLEQSQVNASSQHTPPLTFPRPVQRVPPPPLLPPDSRLHTIRDEWTMTDQLLAEIDRAAHDQDASVVNMNMAGIGASSAQSQHPGVPVPKGPIIERDRERSREKKDGSREGEVVGSGGSAGSAPGRSGSLRQSSRGPQTQQPQTKNVTPPHTPPHSQPTSSQPQRPLPVVPEKPQSGGGSSRPNNSSPTYYPPMASPHAETPHYAQTHPRDSSPQFRYDERQQTSAPPSKTKTPDRLPVQEENEAEEDVTITPSLERDRARERDRQRELDMETVKERPRQMTHRLPTPQFSTSPMIAPDRMQQTETQSDLDMSTTVQGDYSDDQRVYDEVHDGRSSRAGHRFDDVAPRQLDKDDARRHGEHSDPQLEAEDQDETESYTPRSHHANLPQVIDNNPGPSSERVVYNTSTPHLHFRPRTASSDVGGMVNLDAAMIHDAIERLQQPYVPEQGHSHLGARGPPFHPPQYEGFEPPFANSHAHPQNPGLSSRVPTAEEIRALVHDTRAYEAWRHAHSLIRPGAPIPPTPPNATTMATLSYAPPSLSPPPPRSTPYPYSYQYPHIVHRSPDPQQLLQHMQQQQAQQMQLLAANGIQTDSTFSPSSTPYPPYDYNPFLPEHLRRRNGMDEPSMSLRSSPSHLPVNLPLFTSQRRLNSKRKSLRRTRGSRELASKLPPRGESTEPRETSPESSDGEEVEDGEFEDFNDLAAQLESGTSSENVTTERGGGGGSGDKHSRDGGGDDEEEWIDEDEDDEDDLLHLEYHPNYVVNPDKRRKRWELKWNALVKAVRAIFMFALRVVD